MVHARCSIYVLKLKGSKYYVGKTSNIEKRLSQHSRGAGSSWTRKYPVERLLRVFHDCDSYDEDKFTLKLMDKYGIDNVRGGFLRFDTPLGGGCLGDNKEDKNGDGQVLTMWIFGTFCLQVHGGGIRMRDLLRNLSFYRRVSPSLARESKNRIMCFLY